VATQTVGCDVRDRALAPAGEDLIERAAREMPVLLLVRERFQRERPLEGLRVSACLPVTAETANLMITLQAGGADVALCASDPLSTDDAVAAALATSHGVRTYAIEGEDDDSRHDHVASALAHRPDLTMDDGAQLVAELHTGGGRLLDRVLGGTEQTATGLVRLKEMVARGVPRYPVIAVDEAVTDLSLASQALSIEYLGAGRAMLEHGVHEVPVEVGREVARLDLMAMQDKGRVLPPHRPWRATSPARGEGERTR
jgi:adenosylhomocysteinase